MGKGREKHIRKIVMEMKVTEWRKEEWKEGTMGRRNKLRKDGWNENPCSLVLFSNISTEKTLQENILFFYINSTRITLGIMSDSPL